jgi:hypothetical protein
LASHSKRHHGKALPNMPFQSGQQMTSAPQTSGWEIGPPSPALATHAFVPYLYGGEKICIEVEAGQVCGRGEDEHPAGAAAQAGEETAQAE